jgi:hypothetical protein
MQELGMFYYLLYLGVINEGQIQTSEGFDPKPDAKAEVHFIDVADKSLNIRNLSNSNIAYLYN